jgi:hypothetical protein
MANGYKTKVVQAMLRYFCTAHICALSFYYWVELCDTQVLGYVSGKKKAIIPWAKLCKNPSSWIRPECAPDGFQWADPSKIRINDVFSLLDHWRK